MRLRPAAGVRAAVRVCVRRVQVASGCATISAMTELPVERELVELASFGLEYGIRLAANVKGQPFQPALITRDPAGGNNLTPSPS